MLQILEKNTELPTTQTGKVAELVRSLKETLTTLKPDNSEVTQVITYALLAMAVVGIMVYQYIKEND